MGNSQGKDALVDPVTKQKPEENPYVRKILEAREKLTGWERVQLMFTKDEFGDYSPEVTRILHAFCISAVIGAFIGGMGRGRIAHANFMRSTAHEAFESPLQAKRKLQDTVTLGMFSGAYRIGWRISLFTTTYMTVTTMMSTYRGKMSVTDQVVGAGFTGFLYKLPQGPKAQVAGTVVGSVLGLGAGLLTLGLTKLSGETLDSANLRYYQYLAKKEETRVTQNKAGVELLQRIDRPLHFGPGMKEDNESNDLLRFHDQLIVALEEKRQESNDTKIGDSVVENATTDTETTKSEGLVNAGQTVKAINVSGETIVSNPGSSNDGESGNKSDARHALSELSGKT